MTGFCCDRIGGGGIGPWGMHSPGGFIWGLVFWAAIVLLVVGTIWLLRRRKRQPQAVAAEVIPLDVARRRLAAGEITASEFDEIWERLQRGAVPDDR